MAKWESPQLQKTTGDACVPRVIDSVVCVARQTSEVSEDFGSLSPAVFGDELSIIGGRVDSN